MKNGPMKVVIVTGGRNYDNFAMVNDVLRALNPDYIVEGGANGADALARQWRSVTWVEGETFYADWNAHGKAAGPKRNSNMLDTFRQAIVVAFPGGKGTADCVKQALERNMIVLQVAQ